MTVKNLPEIKIMYVKAEGGSDGAREAFNKLEEKLPTLKGRKFYGVIHPGEPHNEYWASVEIISEDKPEEWGYLTAVIPGGKYAQEKIDNWNENIHLIGETFGKIVKEVEMDHSRPCVEFYRSMRDMQVRVPIK